MFSVRMDLESTKCQQSNNDNFSTCLSGQGEVSSSLHLVDVRLARFTPRFVAPCGVDSTTGQFLEAGNGGFVWLCHLWQSWPNGAPAAPVNVGIRAGRLALMRRNLPSCLAAPRPFPKMFICYPLALRGLRKLAAFPTANCPVRQG